MGGGKGLKYEVCVNEIRLEQVSEFKYWGCVLSESGIDEVDSSRKVSSERRLHVPLGLWLL